MNDQYQASIPPLPSKSLAKGPFSCPYCRQMIQLENESDWVYHVHSDLKPYICTLGDCTKSNQLYDSYSEWSGHERQFHLREWFCHICSDTFETESSFSDHLRKLHPQITQPQRKELLKHLEPTTSAQKCPLCKKAPISNLSRFQQHLARHLQDLSRFVLPREEIEDENTALRDGESNESRQALALDDEDKVSLKSTPIENQDSTEDITENSFDQSDADSKGSQNPLMVPDIPDPPRDTIQDHATTSQVPREFEEEVFIAFEALKEAQTSLGLDHPGTLSRRIALSQVYFKYHRIDQFHDIVLKTLEMKKKFSGPENLSTLRAFEDLALAHRLKGRNEEAELVYASVLKVLEAGVGSEHSQTVKTKINLAILYLEMGRYEEAEAIAEEVLNLRSKSHGADDPETLSVKHDLGVIYSSWGNLEKAETVFTQILDTMHHSGNDELELRCKGGLANLYQRQGQLDKAEMMVRDILDRLDRKEGRNQHFTFFVKSQLARIYEKKRQTEASEFLLREVTVGMNAELGPTHSDTFLYKEKLALVMKSNGRLDEAREVIEECWKTALQAFGPDHGQTKKALGLLNEWQEGV